MFAIVIYETDLTRNLFEAHDTCLSMRKTREIVTRRYDLRHGIYSAWPHKHPQFMLESHCSLVLLFPLSLSVASKVLGWGNVETGRRVLTSCLKCSCLYKQPRYPNHCQGKTNMYFYFPCSFWGDNALLLTAVLHLRTFWGVTGVE